MLLDQICNLRIVLGKADRKQGGYEKKQGEESHREPPLDKSSYRVEAASIAQDGA
jgi:hypothetical protein